MLGYGIGIGAPGGAGVLHTSGKAIVVPVLVAWTTDRKFTPTVDGIAQLPAAQSITAPRRPSSEPANTRARDWRASPASGARAAPQAETAPAAAPVSPSASAGCQSRQPGLRWLSTRATMVPYSLAR